MGKAKLTPTSIDLIKSIKDQEKKQAGRTRADFAGVSTVEKSIGSGPGSAGTARPNQNALPTAGGQLTGALSIRSTVTTIVSGVLDISTDTGEPVSNIILIGQGGSADDLVTITSNEASGQLLWLQAHITTSITLKHGTGNIWIYTGVDYVMTSGEAVLLLWDDQNDRWNLIANFNDASGGSGDNLGDHIATQALKMNDSAIFFDTGLIHSIISGTNVMSYIVDDSSGGKHQFFVDDLVTAQFAVEENVVRVLADTLNFAGTNRFLSGLSVLFWKEGGGNDNITSSTSGVTYNVNATDEHFFAVGGSTVMTVDSGEVLFGQDIDLAGNDLDIGNGNIIDMGAIRFNSASGQIISSSVSGILHQVPSGDGHFFFVAGSQVISIVDQGINMDDKELDFNTGGRVDFSDNATTIGSNGAASALTALPVGYAKVKINGVERQMPYYRVA